MIRSRSEGGDRILRTGAGGLTDGAVVEPGAVAAVVAVVLPVDVLAVAGSDLVGSVGRAGREGEGGGEEGEEGEDLGKHLDSWLFGGWVGGGSSYE